MDSDALVDRLRSHDEPDVRELVALYEKTRTQMNKVMSISDVYQAQLHDTTVQLERMARTDILTGLANRRDITERLVMEAARYERHERPFAVILCDIDNFKRVNDTWGHKAGDEVLIRVSEAIKSVLRVSDVCARWGGEEFLVFCPDTELDRALVVAERCRDAVECSYVSVRDEAVSVTISGGVCSCTEVPHPVDWEQMVLKADTAMYAAKTDRKNRIVAAET